ncbi:hypothetical protein EDB85DRAFT_1873873 [Lactarius pseudohatsudake]|nr:hypothetical protein EDB85DRAFT_1873873 [Lactarius pseudohatsudake]
MSISLENSASTRRHEYESSTSTSSEISDKYSYSRVSLVDISACTTFLLVHKQKVGQSLAVACQLTDGHTPDRATTNLSVSFSPNCTVYNQAHKNVLTANSTVSDIWIKFKSKAEEDTFLVNFRWRTVRFEFQSTHERSKGVLTAEQITAYALQLDCQFCTHVFSILIVKDYTQLIQWDRSGTIVTTPIYYRQDPELLDFLSITTKQRDRSKDTTTAFTKPHQKRL